MSDNFNAESFVGSLLILNKSDEFKIYQNFLRMQINLRKDKIVELDINTSEGVQNFNFLKGEISGLETAIALPDRAAEKVEIDRQLKLYEENQKENSNGR